MHFLGNRITLTFAQILNFYLLENGEHLSLVKFTFPPPPSPPIGIGHHLNGNVNLVKMHKKHIKNFFPLLGT